jgi:hypothetical protein
MAERSAPMTSVGRKDPHDNGGHPMLADGTSALLHERISGAELGGTNFINPKRHVDE